MEMALYAAALALLPIFSTSLAIAKLIGSYMDSMARNPEGDKSGSRKLFIFIGFAGIEFMALLCFSVAMMILAKVKG